MCYAFYFMTTANALVFYYVFSDFISFGPKLWVYNFTYIALYFLYVGLILQMFGLQYIYIYICIYSQLNKRRIFLLRHLM